MPAFRSALLFLRRSHLFYYINFSLGARVWFYNFLLRVSAARAQSLYLAREHLNSENQSARYALAAIP